MMSWGCNSFADSTIAGVIWDFPFGLLPTPVVDIFYDSLPAPQVVSHFSKRRR
jgi:hypothetical protein